MNIDEYNGSFDGRNLKLSYRNDNGKERTITGTLSGDIVFRGKHNSKNVNLYLANAPINTMKIFCYIYDRDSFEVDWPHEYHFEEIIPLRDYNERKLINNYNSRVEEYKKAELEQNMESEYHMEEMGWYSYSSRYVSYIDNRIIIFHSSHSEYGGGAHEYGGEFFHAYNINSKFEYGNEIKLSDFIANPKDRRLLYLIRDKFYQSYNWNEESEEPWGHVYDDFDSLIAEEGGIENYDFLITPQGTIKILFYGPYNSYYMAYLFEATFTFEELKPFIKRGSPLDYLFN